MSIVNSLSYPSTPPGIAHRSRVRRRVLLGDEARVIIPLLLASGALLLLFIQTDRKQHRVRAEAVVSAKAAVAAANAPAGSLQREAAAGDQGVVLNIGDGSWIVIRHHSSPDPAADVTVALDSGGQWYVSERYRGLPDTFRDYRQVQPLWAEFRKPRWYLRGAPAPEDQDRMMRGISPALSDVEGCWTLAEAREKLLQLGFRVTPP